MRKTRKFREPLSDEEVQPALKSIEFRKRRGEKLNFLIQRNKILDKQDEDDDFWNNNQYFNKANLEEDDESYCQKDNEKHDSFDSDFKDSSSCSSEDSDNESLKSTKKGTQERPAKRSYKSASKTHFIHDFFKQEQLLREALITELNNKISLEYLIQVEEDKKKIKIDRENQLSGPIMRMTITKEGSTIQFIDYETEPKLLQILDVPPTHNKGKRFKYKDPKTGARFNTLQEYKSIKKHNKIQDQINSLLKKLSP